MAARCYKQRKSQRQYARRKRALKLATDGTDGSPKSVASPRKKKGANLVGVLHPPPVAPPVSIAQRDHCPHHSLYATHTHTHTIHAYLRRVCHGCSVLAQIVRGRFVDAERAVLPLVHRVQQKPPRAPHMLTVMQRRCPADRP